MRYMLPMVMLACGSAEAPVVDDVPVDSPAEAVVLAEPVEPLSPPAMLIRASLDLRGVRPSVEELARIEAEPSALDDMVASFVRDPRFGERVAHMFLETFRTMDEELFIDPGYFLRTVSRDALLASVGWEPLQVLAWIADHDLPYTDLVTADWTVANETLAAMWPLDYPAGETGWKQVHYTDGRPAAGVLSSNGMWWQYGSMLNNLNRGRANTFSRVFLCYDFLDTEVPFAQDTPIGTEAALGEAIRTDPSCKSCHDALDPLASHFFGFWYFSTRKMVPEEVPYYHPQRERAWEDLGGLPPAYAGTPTTGLQDLGRRTADDPRFQACFVRRSWEAMLRRPVSSAEQAEIDVLQTVFVDSRFNVRALFEAITSTTSYREGGGVNGLKVISPATLASQVEHLTGFAWRKGARELMVAPLEGFMALAGGADGIFRSTPLLEPATTQVLVQKRLAEVAAGDVVLHDSEAPESARLFHLIDWTETPESEPDRMAAQLVDLHLMVLSERLSPDDPRIQAELDLWSEIHAGGASPLVAWQGVLSSILRDPSMLVY